MTISKSNKSISKTNKDNKPKPIKVDVSLTEETRTGITKAQFLEVFLAKACSIYAACQACNINRAAYYNWMEKDKVFAKAVRDCRESLIDMVEGRLYEKIFTKEPEDADSQLIKFHLERKAKHRGYGDKSEADVNINVKITYVGKPKEIKDGRKETADTGKS